MGLADALDTIANSQASPAESPTDPLAEPDSGLPGGIRGCNCGSWCPSNGMPVDTSISAAVNTLLDMLIVVGGLVVALTPFVLFARWAKRRMRQRRWIEWPEPPVHISTRPLPRLVNAPEPIAEDDDIK